MKHLNKLLLAAALLPSFAFAQSNYKPGYVVTAKGDTLRGEINQKEWYGNPRSIDFKGSTGIKTYTADDINFFEILNSSAYQRYAGSISTDETNPARLSHGVDSGKKQDVVFLRLEQKGPNVILYSYTDAIKTRYFLTELSTNNTAELVYRSYFLPDQGVKTRDENIFIPKLYELAQKYNPESEDLKGEILKASYNGGDLKEISQKINKMTSDKKTYSSSATIKFFVGVGLSTTTSKPEDKFPLYAGPDYRTIAPSKTTIFPMISAGINIYPNPNVNKLVIRGELQKPSDYSFNQYVVIFNPQVLYNLYNTVNFKFYIDGGVAFNVAKNTGNGYINVNSNESFSHYLQLNTTWFSFPFKLGIVLNNKIDIAVAYTTPADITNSKQYSISQSSVKAGINYLF
jgi:hypothetical protein